MCLADARPVVGADAEHGGPAGGAAGPVDAGYRVRLDAEVVAEGRMRGLGRAELGLLHDREAGEVGQRAQRIGADAGRLPLAAVEGAPLPRPAELMAQLVEDVAVALRGLGALQLGAPALGVHGGTVGRVVAGRPAGERRETHG